ncbi:MAG: Type II secretion system protein F [Firmicutes bacterium ADurb.Bin193]|nr:MAG: Type II secretion system protein F [Firmicutes bacterium ADurb.Bin193]
MEMFKYKAINRDGKIVKGTLDAPDKISAINKLKELKYTPLKVSVGSIFDSEIDLGFLNKVKPKDLSIFCNQFAILLDSGIPVLSALDILKRQTENRKLRKITANMQDEVQKGQSLNAAMRNHKDVFPDIMLNIIEAGELSGNLEDSFLKMSVHFEKEIAITGKIKGSMTYAIVLLFIAVIVIAILLIGVVPNFVKMFESSGTELPGTTKLLLKISGGVTKYWYLILLGIFSLVVGFKLLKRTEIGSLGIDKIKLMIPVVGELNKKIIISRFARILSSLVASGLPLFTALEIVSKVVGNKVYRRAVETVRASVGHGLTLTQALIETDMFMKMTVQMIKVGEDTGRLESVLDKIGDFYDEEIAEQTEKVTSLMEPALISVLAVVIGFIVLSIVQPMFGMMETIG